eukprot:1154903-Pelagomonas_calceolata.AAC.2
MVIGGKKQWSMHGAHSAMYCIDATSVSKRTGFANFSASLATLPSLGQHRYTIGLEERKEKGYTGQVFAYFQTVWMSITRSFCVFGVGYSCCMLKAADCGVFAVC